MKFKITLVFLLICVLSVSSIFLLSACENASKGLEYTLSDDGSYYIVTDIGTCKAEKIVIPSKYKNLPVKEIGANAFYYNDRITSVVIPESITYIGEYAFFNCNNLEKAVFVKTSGWKKIFTGNMIYGDARYIPEDEIANPTAAVEILKEVSLGVLCRSE